MNRMTAWWCVDEKSLPRAQYRHQALQFTQSVVLHICELTFVDWIDSLDQTHSKNQGTVF